MDADEKSTGPKHGGRGVNRLAWLTAVAALLLIGLGGLVTSHEAGMAVPDWPTTYGHNMFLFPVSLWVGGVFYEHTHRLWASGVGMLTVLLAVWLWFRPPAHCSRRLARWLGVLALLGVIAQGVLGGLRVTLYKDELGMVHGALAQVFLVLVWCIAVYTAPWWPALRKTTDPAGWKALVRPAWALSVLIFLQLLAGAAMRHQHAGLAIPDFPLAYGRLWPPVDPAFLEAVNQSRLTTVDYNPITAFHVHLHMGHRLMALLILAGVGGLAWRISRQAGWRSRPARLSQVWFGLILLQAFLGAMTVWSNKAPAIATLHVVTGAASLVWGCVLGLVARQASAGAERASQPLPDNTSLASLSLPHPVASGPAHSS